MNRRFLKEAATVVGWGVATVALAVVLIIVLFAIMFIGVALGLWDFNYGR